MFAPPVAKPKAMQPQRSTVVAQRPSQSAVSQAHLLQRSIGNQAMIRLLAQRGSVTRNEPGAQEKEADSAHRSPKRQRPRGISAKSRSFRLAVRSGFKCRHFPAPRPPIQAKLKIGAVNDPLEHEADRVADQVMRMPPRRLRLRPRRHRSAANARTAKRRKNFKRRRPGRPSRRRRGASHRA